MASGGGLVTRCLGCSPVVRSDVTSMTIVHSSRVRGARDVVQLVLHLSSEITEMLACHGRSRDIFDQLDDLVSACSHLQSLDESREELLAVQLVAEDCAQTSANQLFVPGIDEAQDSGVPDFLDAIGIMHNVRIGNDPQVEEAVIDFLLEGGARFHP